MPLLDWYEALGHDAALLAKGALEGFPDGRVDEERAVHELHARAQRALASVQAPLWTSEARGFSVQTNERAWHGLDVPLAAANADDVQAVGLDVSDGAREAALGSHGRSLPWTWPRTRCADG